MWQENDEKPATSLQVRVPGSKGRMMGWKVALLGSQCSLNQGDQRRNPGGGAA